jgi:uncharacterized 2Fe-2S/4Fe-4S cluster protein (DUF4445 family)
MKLRLPSGETIPALPQYSLLENLKKAGIHIVAPCGGYGVCGRCKIIVKTGLYRTRLRKKLSQAEIAQGYVVACHTYPRTDLEIEIPSTSVLRVEGEAVAASADRLQKIFESFQVDITPLTTHIRLDLPKPTLDDNLSDKERLKRGLAVLGFKRLELPFRLLKDLAKILREADWNVTATLLARDDTWEVLRIRTTVSEPAKNRYGLAIDIGTTTIVAYLADLSTGRLVDAAATFNYQIIYGEDVISRIIYASEQGGLKDLQEAVVGHINHLIDILKEKYRLQEDSINSIVIAGNTVMTHLFFGFDPASIRKEPYVPTANFFPMIGAGRIGLDVTPDTPLGALPCVSGYVGGDIVAGVLTTGIHRNQGLSLFIDIGTNGELVIGNSDWMLAAACSAGPCFEGGGLKHGIRATKGAIDGVRIDPKTLKPEVSVIGGGAAEGICGSGIIDAISEMFLNGIITPNGKIRTDLNLENFRLTDEGPEFVLCHTEAGHVSVTELDIDNVMRAKAAIYAGLSVLLQDTGLTYSDIDTYYIAGGFGQSLNVEKSMVLGLLPDQPKEKFRYVGNTAVTGAYLCLLSKTLRREAEEIARRITYVELTAAAGFMDAYIAGLFLPHTHQSAFPTVSGMINRRGRSA